jgi:hypothetical protein
MVEVADTVWHDDGHVMALQLNQAEVSITTTICPHPKGEGDCWHQEVGCLVAWFLDRFGLDCHVGVASPEPEMGIAWSFSGTHYDLDAAQVWVMSVKDDFYSAWVASQRPQASSSQD